MPHADTLFAVRKSRISWMLLLELREHCWFQKAIVLVRLGDTVLKRRDFALAGFCTVPTPGGLVMEAGIRPRGGQRETAYRLATPAPKAAPEG